MKIVFLGTNGWYDTKTGNTVCTFIETEDRFIILDAGNGLYKIDRYIKSEKPIYIFLSHFHLDHIIGLHILNKFNFRQGINIFGQLGTKNILKTIINKPYTMPLDKLCFDAQVHEIGEGQHTAPFSIKCKFLLHSSPCLGYRMKIDDKVVTYCPDTGPCNNVLELANQADLFIAECSYASGQQDNHWPHLNPEEAAKIAKKAAVKRLVLTHFDAGIYETLKEKENAKEKAKSIFANTVAAVDDLVIYIDS